jgi:deoxyribonuclease V
MTCPGAASELEAFQRCLAAEHPPSWSIPAASVAIAGCFICFETAAVAFRKPAPELAWAGAAVVRDGKLVATSVVTADVTAPYTPGLLALREGALLESAVRALPFVPDVLLVDATGRDHPRRAGLALHLGAVIGLPTVGVTQRALLAKGEPPEEQKGSQSPIFLDGQVVGCWLRSRTGARPVAVHPGWRTDLRTAVAVVGLSLSRARTPEPLRRAREIARNARALASKN